MSARERRSALATLCVEALKRRERKRKRERDCEEVHSMNFVPSFTEYNKDKVLVDVATSLVVNHINIGVLCPFMLCCVYVYGEVTNIDNT